MEKNKPRRLVFWFCGFFCVWFFFSFYKSLLMFWPKYNKWEVKPTDMIAVPVTSQEPPLSPLLHLFPTGVPWGSHRPLKPPWVYCFPTVVPGSSCSWQERRAPLAVGRSWQNFSRMWDRWKDKHPWNTRRLETFIYACVYVSMWSKLLCVYICGPSTWSKLL